MDIEPLEKKSLSDYVVQKIKSLILAGTLNEGDRLPSERELTEMFAVSRSSVREGMKILSLQGLVKRTNAGTEITANFSSILEETLTLKILLDDIEYSQVSEARLFLEKTMVGLAAQRISESDISEMKKHIDNMIVAKNKGKNDDFVLADIAFHQQIAKASRSNVLECLYNSIIMLIFKVQKKVGYDDTIRDVSIDYHKKILSALIKKDANLAEYEMQQHLLDVQHRLDHLIKIDKVKLGE